MAVLISGLRRATCRARANADGKPKVVYWCLEDLLVQNALELVQQRFAAPGNRGQLPEGSVPGPGVGRSVTGLVVRPELIRRGPLRGGLPLRGVPGERRMGFGPRPGAVAWETRPMLDKVISGGQTAVDRCPAP